MRLMRGDRVVRNMLVLGIPCGVRFDEVRLHREDIELLYMCSDEKRKSVIENLLVRFTHDLPSNYEH